MSGTCNQLEELKKMAERGLQPAIDQLMQTLKRRPVAIGNEETDGHTNAVAALVQTDGKACLIIGIGATHQQIKDILDDIDHFASSLEYMQADVNFTTKQQPETDAYIYTIDVGYLEPIVWAHLKDISQKLATKGNPPRVDMPLEKWAVTTLNTNIIVAKTVKEAWRGMCHSTNCAKTQLDTYN